MTNFDWHVYDRDWMGYPPERQAEILIDTLELYGDPVAMAWYPEGALPPTLTEHIYDGPLRLMHCQYMMRSRFRLETYVLDGTKARPEVGKAPVCNGDGYVGLAPIIEGTEHGAWNTMTNPKSGQPATPRIYGAKAASMRNLVNDYTIIPNVYRYLAVAPLSDCHFDPDIVVLFGNPKQMMYASRALQWYSGITPKSRTGPGTCSSSWAEAYMTGEPRYTLGCFGVFSVMAMNPNHVALSIPSEMMPQMVNVLEQWVERGRPLFTEEPHDEEREYVLSPMNAEYVKADMYKPNYVSWKKRLDEPYKDWAERRKEKGLSVPAKKHGAC
jgi:uncharacterized protein (DUF169 family)